MKFIEQNSSTAIGCCISLPTDYTDYGDQVKRWENDNNDYLDCSCNCKHFWPMFNERTGEDADYGVCMNPNGPRRGMLTFEHQAGFKCFEAK